MLDSEVDTGNEKLWTDGISEVLFGVGPETVKKVKVPSGLIRKERVLIIPIIHLMGILTGRAKVWLPKDIPQDAFPLRTFQDESSHAICIVVGHPTFPPVEPGFVIPKFQLVVSYPDLDAPRIELDLEIPPAEDHEEREV
jgi:hypothetical protein